MGLDVYLYTKEQAERSDQYKKASEAWHEGGGYASATEDERKAWHEANPWPGGSTDMPSKEYPDHLFNRRYLRSSYNAGGFNHAVPEFLGTASDNYPNERGSLNWIFQEVRVEDQYEIDLTEASVPALEDAKGRALQVAKELSEISAPLRVAEISPNVFSAPPVYSESEALALYRRQLPLREDWDWYSANDIEVFGEGMTVLAAVPGRSTLGAPCVHLIYQAPGDTLKSYIESAVITAEFCDEAIELIRKDGGCRMVWSG